jgi:hypothetical protein
MDLEQIFEEEVRNRQESDFMKEQFSDPFSEEWTFSAIVYITVPYGPGTPNGYFLNENYKNIAKKNIERVLPMMHGLKNFSTVIDFDKSKHMDEISKPAKFTIKNSTSIIPPYHAYFFSFNEKFKIEAETIEFLSLLKKATWKTSSSIDIIYNKGEEGLLHQCSRHYPLIHLQYAEQLLDFIKKAQLYGTHQI